MSRRNKREASSDEYEEEPRASTSTSNPGQFKRMRGAVTEEDLNRGRSSNGNAGKDVEETGTQSGEGNEMDTEEDELDDEDPDDYIESTQLNRRGMEAEMGVIEKINLTNFMCHDRLEINLGDRLNFVIGHNGSGKSAVLTAITIALGGKATATSRGNSLKSFVKEGKQAAIVEVTIKNKGPEAFKHTTYGDKIIVERMIRADGTGSWKIKGQAEKIVSASRAELNAICDHANIQVDNPMNILTQDAARHFLSASHSDEKYQFFLKGTQLQQLANEYDIVQVNMQRIKAAIERGEGGLPELAEKAREANSQLEVLKRTRNQKDQIQALRNEIVWAYVAEKEKEFEKMILRLEGMRTRRRKIEEQLKNCKKEEEIQEATISDFEKRSGENVEREAPLLLQMKALKEQERVFHQNIRGAKEEETTLNDQYKRLKLQIDGLIKRIEVETRKSNDGNQGRRNALLTQQRQADLEKKKLEKQEADERDRSAEFDREIAKLDGDIIRLETQREHFRNMLSNAEGQIVKLNGAKTNRLNAFGQSIPALMQAIERETRWRQKPVGPIGNHLKLTDRKWAPLLESVLGNTLNAFCVTNSYDQTLLQDCMRRANCGNVSILKGSDEAFDFSSGVPEEGLLTILRVLHIESDYITRQLVTALHIENSVLVEARAEGDILLRRRLRNVKACYSLDMYRLGGGNIGSSTQTIQSYNGPPRLSLDIETQLREVMSKKEEAQVQVQNISRDLQDLQFRRNADIEAKREIRQRIPALQRQARQKHAESERIEEELREDEPTNIAALVEAKKEHELEQERIQEKFQDLHAQIEENEKQMKPLIDERLKIKKIVETMQEQSKDLKPMLEEAARSRLEAHRNASHWEVELDTASAKVEDLDVSAKTLENEVEHRTSKAQEQCERVPTSKSTEQYEKEIEAAEKQVLAATRQHGQDPEAVTLLVQQCSANFQKAQADIETLKEVYRDLKAAIVIRLTKWRKFRKHISVRAKGAFASYLNNRGYNGNIIFNHDQQTLKLQVQTDEANGVTRYDKDPKSLSGGEKSFATICLLLALWESIGCPIRCLDEFDVFMDAVNRKISMSMMMEAARGANGVQYVLITPQNISNITLGTDVRVIRLNDPERNQSTLNMGEA